MTDRSGSSTLIDVARPAKNTLLWDAALIVLFGTAMAAFARISFLLPFTPVPITGQTLGVLLTGALLGSRRGAIAMLVYLGEGLIGLPVFAQGASAWTPSVAIVPTIVGPSAGYLFSYPIAAFVVGFLAERGWARRFGSAVLTMFAGEAVIYAVGLPWLALYVGARHAVPLGLLPFIPGDIAKLLLAAALLPSGWLFVSAIRH
ncbi:MAG TPA: biotin transporter BioY [Bryobacteraceae bacterium]|nr:biotin transporter BioY [Bryobacteraceae bacterium]